MDGDFRLALRLQEEYDREETDSPWQQCQPVLPQSPVRSWQGKPATKSAVPGDMSVVDPSWEMLDPSPDIRGLFLQFNALFFCGKLAGVEVKWSPRMTLCAGVCSYEGSGGLCSIRLSAPLLKLRSRKDLVETLLHEMIHALLFVTHNNKDHDSHGPEFCKHMRRINDITGANISVYHNFHDEVAEYRKHWWLCNGPCQKRRPYFGYVKRAMNRAPSSLDPWWSDHQQTCGGTFTKVKEPENYSKKGKGKNVLAKPQVGKPPGIKDKILGVDIRTVIPFSGIGYKLVEPSKAPMAWKVPSSSDNAFTAETTKPSPHNLLFQHSFPSTHLNHKPFLSGNIDINNSASKKTNMPKISVANIKAFINVNGSPVKLLPLSGNNVIAGQSPSKGKREFPSSNMIQKKISFELPSSSQRTPSSSQGSSTVEYLDQPPKRPRMDNKTTVENFFVKAKGASGSARNSGSLPNTFNSSTGSTAITISSGSSQSMSVKCPVCRTEVSESKINSHLDSCLAAC